MCSLGWFPTHLDSGALVLLPSEGASFVSLALSSCGLTEDSEAGNTPNYCLYMADDGGDFKASWAFHIMVWELMALHQVLLLVFPLLFWRGMDILSERHVVLRTSSQLESLSAYFSNCKYP